MLDGKRLVRHYLVALGNHERELSASRCHLMFHGDPERELSVSRFLNQVEEEDREGSCTLGLGLHSVRRRGQNRPRELHVVHPLPDQ